MEIWDAYNIDGSLAGVDIKRGEPIPDGLFFLMVEILVRHTDGDYLLMHRDPTKKAFPGYLEATAGGAALKGEDPYTAALRELREETGISADEVDKYLLHQANVRIIDAIQHFLAQPADKFPANIADHGNSSSASCPILLDECNRNGMFKKGDKVVMSAFGAGFVSGALLFEW